MYPHHITHAVAEAHAGDMHRTAARDRTTAPVHPRHRRRAIAAALVALCALGPTTGANARPADSVTAKWQSYDGQIAKLSPEERAAAFGRQDLRSPDTQDAAARIEARQDLRNPDNRTLEAARAWERYYSSYANKADEAAQDLRSPDARDAAAGRGTFNAPNVAVVKLPQPAPVAEDGIDWGDVGIGAGTLFGMVALGLTTALVIVHRRRRRPLSATAG
jgi:hypothetical protein